MLLNHGIHLGYCTNIHRGESWEETWRGLREHTLRVRERVAAGRSYGIGLRLSAIAARELAQPGPLAAFQRWLEDHDCYVFTINGFPYGAFHGTRVKEQVFKPDWTTRERLSSVTHEPACVPIISAHSSSTLTVSLSPAW